MSLSTSELRRIRAELGYNTLLAGAEPYIGVHAVFDQVVAEYLQAGAATTSATAVAAASSPTPVALTLASATGFSAGDRVVIDVDTRQEIATIQSVSGAAITVQLSLTHSGTYPVTVEGGETIVRRILRNLATISEQIDNAGSTAGIKKVDEIEFFGEGSQAQLSRLLELQMSQRDELASVLGVQNLWRVRQGANLSTSLY